MSVHHEIAYSARTVSGRNVDGRIVEHLGLGETHERLPRTLLEWQDVASRAAAKTGEPVRVVRDDGTIASEHRP